MNSRSHRGTIYSKTGYRVRIVGEKAKPKKLLSTYNPYEKEVGELCNVLTQFLNVDVQHIDRTDEPPENENPYSY